MEDNNNEDKLNWRLLMTNRKIQKDINKIYNDERKKYLKTKSEIACDNYGKCPYNKTEVEKISSIHERIYNYYNNPEINSSILISRLSSIEFTLKYFNNIFVSLLFGVIASIIVAIISADDISPFFAVIYKSLQNSFSQGVVVFILVTLIILFFVIIFIIAPMILFIFLGYLGSYRILTKPYDIIVTSYEKEVILARLNKEGLNLDYLK